MPDRTVQLVLHYDGARFAGWQRQRAARTVQGVLEQILQQLTGAPRPVTGAGRTDSGVHARGQATHVRVPERWTAAQLRRGVNALAPDDLWVAAAYEMHDRFHARYSARSRCYDYYVATDEGSASPFRRRYEWRPPWPLDEEALHGAAQLLPGEHGFRGFSVRGTAPEEDDHRCVVLAAEWRGREGGYVFRIEANRFLHHMVRFLVGTMVDVAAARRTMASFAALLDAGDNQAVSPPAPPHALFLDRVTYPAELYLSPAAMGSEMERV